MKDEKDEKLEVSPADANYPALGELLDSVPMADMLLRKTKDLMWSMVQFRELQMAYTCALKEVRTKFEVLDTAYESQYKRNPIKTITTRVKRMESIIEKLMRYDIPVTLENVEEKLNDVAGIRVVCSYIDDIYSIADSLLRQDDITLVRRKDYIANPKPNGYRSLHLIVKVPVFFANQRREMKVEVQIRTIAMDFWASLEHQISYKHDSTHRDEFAARLKECADGITAIDEKMLQIRKEIEEAEDIPTEDELLLERLRKTMN